MTDSATTTEFPTGIVTFLFSDIQGSTELWERLDERFHAMLEEHNAIFREALAKWNGCEVKTEGDAFMVAFALTSDALQCAIEIQQRLTDHPWSAEVGEVLVRMGLHTGQPLGAPGTRGEQDYFGPCVNRAARIAAAGYGGQILASEAAKVLAEGARVPKVKFVDQGSHWLKGLDRPERIFEVRHPDLPVREFPELTTLDRKLHELPEQLTDFIGRDQELKTVVEMCESESCRLVNLIGPGGIGKTRLAIQVASYSAEKFRDGVWFVELVDAMNTEQALAAMASALKVPVQTDRDLNKQLQDFLAHKQLLLVLDNIERIPHAGRLVTDLLKTARSIKCLVTSRAIIRVRGENVYEVPVLPIPSAARTASRDLLHCQSVALFVDRTQAINPEWRLTSENEAAVAGLCRKLEGIPLAIELAAARTRSLSPKDILYRLNHRLEFLKARLLDLPERQRTLRGAIDWSYELLTEEEKSFFVRLAAFTGGFFKYAVEEVVNDPNAVELAENLRDKSLLTVREMRGYNRFFMLDSIREYAEEKLHASEAVEAEVKQRHAAYFLRFAEMQVAKFRSREERNALIQMEEDLDNLRTSLGWAEINEPLTCARIAQALGEFLLRRGLWAEAKDCNERGLAAAVRADDPKALAHLHAAAASLEFDRCAYAVARDHAGKSLATAREIDDAKCAAYALNLLGIIACDESRFDEAKDFLVQSLATCRNEGYRVGEAMALHNLGRVAERRGDFAEAERVYEEALLIRREVGDRRGEAETSLGLSVVHQDNNECKHAREHYEDCLEIWEELQDIHGKAFCLHNLGEVTMALGNLNDAVSYLNEALRLFQDLGSPLAETTAKVLGEAKNSLTASS